MPGRRGSPPASRRRTSPPAGVGVCAPMTDPAAGRAIELYEEAKDLRVPGRSRMNKAQLERAVDRKRGR